VASPCKVFTVVQQHALPSDLSAATRREATERVVQMSTKAELKKNAFQNKSRDEKQVASQSNVFTAVL
jgi:hypothetical protein